MNRFIKFEARNFEEDFLSFGPMASVSVVPASGLIRDTSGSTVAVDRLPDEMNDMKIKDDKVKGLFLFLFYKLVR